jgi:hypothetical protein
MPSPLDDPQASSPSIESRADPIDSSSSVPVPPELSSSSSAPLAIEDKPAAQPVGEEESVKDDGEEVHVLDVGEGNVVKLDKLGPMIINTDGVSRWTLTSRFLDGIELARHTGSGLDGKGEAWQ